MQEDDMNSTETAGQSTPGTATPNTSHWVTVQLRGAPTELDQNVRSAQAFCRSRPDAAEMVFSMQHHALGISIVEIRAIPELAALLQGRACTEGSFTDLAPQRSSAAPAQVWIPDRQLLFSRRTRADMAPGRMAISPARRATPGMSLVANTDGSASSRLQSAGLGFSLHWEADSNTLEEGHLRAAPGTDCMQAEMLAAVVALRLIALGDPATGSVPSDVLIRTDCEQVVIGVRSFQRGDPNPPAKNTRLWSALAEQLRALDEAGCQVTFNHVAGHAGDPGNERVHELATQGRLACEKHMLLQAQQSWQLGRTVEVRASQMGRMSSSPAQFQASTDTGSEPINSAHN